MTISEIVKKSCQLDPGKDYNLEVIDGRAWFFFHASWSRQDWIRDFQCWTVGFRHLRLHYGYFREFLDTLDFVQSDLIDLLKQGITDIVFTGYSRGAALAWIFDEYYHDSLSFTTHSICIGCPRTFLKTNATRGPFYLVTYGNDAVTFLPPWFDKPQPLLTMHHSPTGPGFINACKDHAKYLTWHDPIHF